jgi:tetratricopeptide (TPR) repeat protein
MREKYQVQILSPLYVGHKMDVHFPPKERATKHYRVVVLHRLRDGTNYLPEASRFSMSPRALRQHVPERARNAYERGVLLHNQGKLEQALTAYGEAIRNSPEYIPALIDVGSVYIGLNRPDSALTFLRRAYRVDQSNPIVRMKLAIALMAKRQYAEAAELLEKVYRGESRKSVPLFYLASIQFYQKNYSEAQELLREALAEDPGMVDGWVLFVNMALEQAKYPEAREGLVHLRKAMNNEVFTRFVEDQLAALN